MPKLAKTCTVTEALLKLLKTIVGFVENLLLAVYMICKLYFMGWLSAWTASS